MRLFEGVFGNSETYNRVGEVRIERIMNGFARDEQNQIAIPLLYLFICLLFASYLCFSKNLSLLRMGAVLHFPLTIVLHVNELHKLHIQ